MRSFCFLALLTLATSAFGQSSLGSALQPGFKKLSDLGIIHAPANPNPNPLDPKGQGLPDPLITDPEAPGSTSDREIRILKAPKQKLIGNLVFLEGGVHIQFRGYDIVSESVTGDRRTQIFELSGGATIVGAEGIVSGETITVDFKNRTYNATQHRGSLTPEALGGRTLSEVYVSGARSEGSEREIHERDGRFTTCDLDVPHYSIDANDITIRPEKRIIFRNTRIRVLGHTLVSIPYMAVPLDSRRDRYSPEVGFSRDQGYFIKTIWGVPIDGNRDLDANVDYFSKLGFGLGGRYRFASANAQGFLRAYGIVGNDPTMEITGGLREFFGANQLQIESNYQRKNYLNAPQNAFLNTRASFSIPQGRNTTRLSFYQTRNQSDAFQTTSRTIGLSDDRKFGAMSRWVLNVNWVFHRSEFSSSSSQQREQIDVNFKGTTDLRKALAELEYQRSIPVGDTANFFSAADRTPVLSLKTDSNRLVGGNFARQWPIAAEMSFGEFANSSRTEHIQRTMFDVSLNRPENSSARSSFGMNGRFRQSVYSDNTAQFSTLINANYRYNFTRDTSFNFRYNFLRPRGFTPLSMDRVGNFNVASTDVSVKVFRPLTVGMQSSYDFRFKDNGLETGWQQVGARMEYRPSDALLGRAQSTYDPLLKKWSNTRIDLTFEKSDLYLGVGARYDGLRDVWSSVNLFVDGLKVGKMTLSALLTYNGYTKQFDTRQYSLVYDMHCTEAVLQVLENNVGFRSGRQIYAFIRIKAFPFATPFGTGTNGQPIGTSTGFGY